MSIKFGNIIQIILKKEEISPLLQERIYDFAVKNKRTDLLSSLLELDNLTDNLDNKLKNINTASVRIAWLSRKNRKVNDIKEALISEKRVTILREILSNPNTSNKIYNTFFDIVTNNKEGTLNFKGVKFKNQTQLQYEKLLEEIINNTNLKKEIRIKAGKIIVDNLLNPALINNYSSERANRFSSIFRSVNDLVIEYKDNKDINLLTAAAEFTALTHDEQVKVLTPLIEQSILELTQKEIKNTRYYHDGYFGDFTSLVKSLYENSEVKKETNDKIIEVLDLAEKKYSSSYYIDNIKNMKKLVNNRISIGLSFKEQVRKIKSQEEMQSVISEFEELNKNSIISFSGDNLNKLAEEMIISKFCSPKMSKIIYEWYFNYYNENKNEDIIQKIDQSDLEKIAYSIIARSYYFEDFDKLISLTENSKAVFKKILELVFIEKEDYNKVILFNSKYMKEEYINILSLDDFEILANHSDTDLLTNQLESTLNTIASNQTAWENYISLADEFEGTFQQLEQLSSKI